MAVVTQDGFTVTSSDASEDAIRAALSMDSEGKVAEPASAVETVEAEAPDAEEPPQEAKPELQGKKRKSLQDRIDEITREKYDSIRERDAAKQELAALRAELESLKQPKQEPKKSAPASGDPEPQEADFDNYSAYVKAQAKWEARQEIAAEREAARVAYEQQMAQRAAQERQQKLGEKLAKAREIIPDFDSRLDPSVAVSAPMRDFIEESDQTGALMLYLSENPQESQRLATLHPIHAIREMAKIEARLDTAHSGPVSSAPKSKAPKPIQPVGGGAIAVESDDDEMPFGPDYVRRMNAKESRSRR